METGIEDVVLVVEMDDAPGRCRVARLAIAAVRDRVPVGVLGRVLAGVARLIGCDLRVLHGDHIIFRRAGYGAERRGSQDKGDRDADERTFGRETRHRSSVRTCR